MDDVDDTVAGAGDVRLQVLGPVAVLVDGVEVDLPTGKPRAILACLGLRGGGPVLPADLVTSLWGEDAAGSAAKTLQVHVSTLRRRLRPCRIGIRLDAFGYSLDLPPLAVDLARFDHLASEGSSALEDGRVQEASKLLREALAEWSGDPLSNVLDAPFAAHEADRLLQRRLGVFHRTIDADLQLGLGSALVNELTDATAAHPFDEHACAQLMVALYRSGRPSDALSAFQRLRASLADELGTEPSPSLRDLEMRILNHDPGLVVAPLARPAAQHRLPVELSTFVGRRAEVESIGAALQQARLVTLTGAGGAGKTRLAQRVGAEELGGFPGGAWMVELAPLAEPNLVAASVANCLEIRDEPERPLLETLVEAIGDQRILIVLDNCEHVIEAAAQLAEALLTACGQLAILATSREPLALPGERVVRVPPLGLAPVGATDVEEIAGCDSVRLFVERASLHTPDFAATTQNAVQIAEMCRQLDGMPLAIELAAAQLRTFTVDELAALLEERFRLLVSGPRRASARHQTLKALIDWSYDLLAPEEQIVLDTLSVFAGGFAGDAAQEVCSPSTDADVRSLLAALVDKSLVEFDRSRSAGRFRLMETVRQYAAERLLERGAGVVEAARGAHAAHYLSLAEAAERVFEAEGDEVNWLDRLDLELENLRAASASLVLSPDGVEGALRLATALRLFWNVRGHAREGAEQMSALLAHPLSPLADRSWPRALIAATELFLTSGQLQRCSECALEAVAAARVLGDPALEAETQLLTVRALLRDGDFEGALAVLEKLRPAVEASADLKLMFQLEQWTLIALGYTTRPGDAIPRAQRLVDWAREGRRWRHLTIWLSNLAYFLLEDGDFAGAVEHLTEAEAHAARLGYRWQLGSISTNLGLAATLSGDHVKARIHYEQARAYGEEVADPLLVGYGTLGLALCEGAQGRDREAVRLHGVADAALREAGMLDLPHVAEGSMQPDPVESKLREADQARLRDVLGAAAFDAEYALGSVAVNTGD